MCARARISRVFHRIPIDGDYRDAPPADTLADREKLIAKAAGTNGTTQGGMVYQNNVHPTLATVLELPYFRLLLRTVLCWQGNAYS